MSWFTNLTETASSLLDAAPQVSAPVATRAAGTTSGSHRVPPMDWNAPVGQTKTNAFPQYTCDATEADFEAIDATRARTAASSLAEIAATDDPVGVMGMLSSFGVHDAKKNQMREQLEQLSPALRAKTIEQMRASGMDAAAIAKAQDVVADVAADELEAKQTAAKIGGGVAAAEKAAQSGNTADLRASIDAMSPAQREAALEQMSPAARDAANAELGHRRARLELIAERLDNARGIDTDELAIVTNMSGLSASEADELAQVYGEKYTTWGGEPRNLRDDLVGEFDDEDPEAELVRAVLSGRTAEASKLSVDVTIDYLQSETGAWVNADESAINELLRAHNKDPEAAKKIATAYELETGTPIEVACAGVMDDAEMKEAHANIAGDTATANVAVIEQGDSDRATRVIEDVQADAGAAGLEALARDMQAHTGKLLGSFVGEFVGAEDMAQVTAAEAAVVTTRDASLDAALTELAKDPAALAAADLKAQNAASQLSTQLSRMHLFGNNTAVTDQLRGLSPAEVKLVMKHYKAINESVNLDGDLEAALRSNLEGADLKVANAALTGDKVLTGVALVEQAADGLGTDVGGWKAAMDTLETDADRAQFLAMMDKHEGRAGSYQTAVTSETSSFDRDALVASGIVNTNERAASMAQVAMTQNAYGGKVARWMEGYGDTVGDWSGETGDERAERRMMTRSTSVLAQLSNVGGNEDAQLDALASLQNQEQVDLFKAKMLAETGWTTEQVIDGEMSSHQAAAAKMYANGDYEGGQAERMVGQLDGWVDDNEDGASLPFEQVRIDPATQAQIMALPAGEQAAATEAAKSAARRSLLDRADEVAFDAGKLDYRSMLVGELSAGQLAVADDRREDGKASDVNALFAAGDTWFGLGKNTAKMTEVMQGKTPDEMATLETEFETAHPGLDLEEWLASRASSEGERRDFEILGEGNYARMSPDALAAMAANDPTALIDRIEAFEMAARGGGETPTLGNAVSNLVVDQVGNAGDRVDGRLDAALAMRDKLADGETLTAAEQEALITHTRYMGGDQGAYTTTKTETVGTGASIVGTAAEVGMLALTGNEAMATAVANYAKMQVNGTFNPGRHGLDQQIAERVGLATDLAGGLFSAHKNPLLGAAPYNAQNPLLSPAIESLFGAAGSALGDTQNYSDGGKLVTSAGTNLGTNLTGGYTGYATKKGLDPDTLLGKLAGQTTKQLAVGDDTQTVGQQLYNIGSGTAKSWWSATASGHYASQRETFAPSVPSVEAYPDAKAQIDGAGTTESPTTSAGYGTPNATSPEGLTEYDPMLVAAFNAFGGLFG